MVYVYLDIYILYCYILYVAGQYISRYMHIMHCDLRMQNTFAYNISWIYNYNLRDMSNCQEHPRLKCWHAPRARELLETWCLSKTDFCGKGWQRLVELIKIMYIIYIYIWMRVGETYFQVAVVIFLGEKSFTRGFFLKQWHHFAYLDLFKLIVEALDLLELPIDGFFRVTQTQDLWPWVS